MGRQTMEMVSRGAAGIRDETDDYYWVRVLNSFDMYVMKDDESVTPCLVKDGFWEAWISEYIKNRIDVATVFFDVGANTGYYSLLAHYFGAMVAAFEPNPAYFDMLLATKERNGLGSMFHVSSFAVSDKVGTETLYIPKRLHGSASFSELDAKWETTAVDVQTTPLSLEGCGRYLVKIDAEGAEEKIWDGMIDSLKKRVGPSEVLLEYTPGAYSTEFIDKLEDYSRIHWINHNAQAEPVTKQWIESQTDWVMLSLGNSPGRMVSRG